MRLRRSGPLNTFVIVPAVDEDIHTANERRLGEIIGKEVAGKLHTGRSRNEQVAADMRMWLRDQLWAIERHLKSFLKVVAQRAEKEIDFVMPGYTHSSEHSPFDGVTGCCRTDSPLPTIWCVCGR